MWEPKTTFGRSFLTINGIDEDSSKAEKRGVLGEEIDEGLWVNPEWKVFKRDSFGHLREMLSLEEHVDRKMEAKEKAYQAGLEPEPGGEIPALPPITWAGLYRVHQSLTDNMCRAFRRPVEEWPLFVPFNPMVEVPYDPVSKETYYTFTPPTGYKLREKGSGWAWVNEVVGKQIISMIAYENNVSHAAVLEALDGNDSR